MRSKIYSLILCGFFLGLLVSCGGGGGDNSSFLNPPGTPGGQGSTQTGTQIWSTALFTTPIIQRKNPLSIQIVSSPAVAPDGTIYVGSTDNGLYALNPDGTVKWRYVTGDWITASPAIGSDGTVYVGSADRQLYAINPNGTLKWVYPTKVIFTSSPALGTDGTIYAAGTDLDKTLVCNPTLSGQLSTFYALNPTGTLKWSITLVGAVNSSPVIASDGTIYIGSDMDPVFDRPDTCNVLTGAYPPSDANPSYPVNGHVYAINPNGTLKWVLKALGGVDSSAAIAADGTIYIGSDAPLWAYGADTAHLIPIGSLTTGFLYSINPNGTLRWFTDLFGNVKSSPAIGSDGTIYVGSDKEDVFAVNTDGTIKWVFPTKGPVKSSPALAADGTIYIGSNDAYLYALNPDGTLKFSFIPTDKNGNPIPESVTSSPSIKANGTIYFASGITPSEGSPFVGATTSPVLYALGGNSALAKTVWTKFRRDLPNTGRQ